MLAVVAHFTSKRAQLTAITLAMTKVQGDHSGQKQAEIVLDVVNDFGFREKLGYFVMDNVGSNDQLVVAIADSLSEEGTIYNANHRRLRYNGHIINLAVKAFLFGQVVTDYELPESSIDTPTSLQLKQWRKMGPLGKLHNIIVWIMGSPQRCEEPLHNYN